MSSGLQLFDGLVIALTAALASNIMLLLLVGCLWMRQPAVVSCTEDRDRVIVLKSGPELGSQPPLDGGDTCETKIYFLKSGTVYHTSSSCHHIVKKTGEQITCLPLCINCRDSRKKRI